MPSKFERAIRLPAPVPFSRMDVRFADKRVVPPFRQPETRIAGTLHLPTTQLKAAQI